MSQNAKRLFVIFNPVAGGGRRDRLDSLLASLAETDFSVTLWESKIAGDVTVLARRAVAEGADMIAVAGGDGTVSEVLGGVDGSKVAIAPLPFGTANVFAYEVGMPKNVKGMVRVLLAGKSLEMYVPEVNGRPFVMWVGMGFDADVVARVNHKLKKWIGKLAYVWAGLCQFWAMPQRRCDVCIDGEAHVAGGFIVCNGRHYAGPFVLAPTANVAEESLVVVLLPKMTRIGVLRFFAGLVLGRGNKLSGVKQITAQKIEIMGVDAAIQVDGDVAGNIFGVQGELRIAAGKRLAVVVNEREGAVSAAMARAA